MKKLMIIATLITTFNVSASNVYLLNSSAVFSTTSVDGTFNESNFKKNQLNECMGEVDLQYMDEKENLTISVKDYNEMIDECSCTIMNKCK